MNDTSVIVIVVLAALSYLVGSVPSGLWLGLWLRKVDIREHGSKNIGATNTMRVLGKRLGAAALVADVGKGLLAVLAVPRLGLLVGPDGWQYTPLVCGLAAIVGHTFSVYIRFKGGKGVATSTGVFLGLLWLPTLAGAVVFFATVFVTRMVSAGSCLAAATVAVSTYLYTPDPVLRVVVTAVAALVIFRHRANIQRILRGRENKI